MTKLYEYLEDAEAAEVPLCAEAGLKENIVVGPLTDDQAEQGGLVSIKAFMRTKRSKAAQKKAAQRAKRAEERQERELTIIVGDSDRDTIKLAASRMMEDKSIRPAVSAVCTNPEYCSLISHMEKDAESREAIKLVCSNPKYAKIARALSLDPKLFASLKLVLEQPNIIRLGKAVLAAKGFRRSLILRLLSI